MFIKDSFLWKSRKREKHELDHLFLVCALLIRVNFPRDKDRLTSAALLIVAAPFKDHRDCNLEEQPGGEGNRRKERRLKRE